MKLNEIEAPANAQYFRWNEFLKWLNDWVDEIDLSNQGWIKYYECWKAGFVLLLVADFYYKRKGE